MALGLHGGGSIAVAAAAVSSGSCSRVGAGAGRGGVAVGGDNGDGRIGASVGGKLTNIAPEDAAGSLAADDAVDGRIALRVRLPGDDPGG